MWCHLLSVDTSSQDIQSEVILPSTKVQLTLINNVFTSGIDVNGLDIQLQNNFFGFDVTRTYALMSPISALVIIDFDWRFCSVSSTVITLDRDHQNTALSCVGSGILCDASDNLIGKTFVV